MGSARGDALEWALALAQAPGERHALRDRELPPGISELLQIASGGQGAALANASERSGLSSQELVEAVRFYLREVLFFSDADAYRLLGLPRGADEALIKQHHRLLQQWLHPDRPTSDWDAAFAARVNAAWSLLRTPARRAEYDEQTPIAVLSERPSWSMPVRLQSAPEPPRLAEADRWRRRVPVLTLFAVCGVLGMLALRDMQREPAGGFDEQRLQDVTTTPGANPGERSGTIIAKAAAKPVATTPAVIAKPASKPPVVVAQAPKAASRQPLLLPKPVQRVVAVAPPAKPKAAPVIAKPVPKPPVIVAQAPKVAPRQPPLLPKPVPRVVAVAPPAKPRAAPVIPKPVPKPPVVVAQAPKVAPRQPPVLPRPVPPAIAVAPPAKPKAAPVIARPVPAPVARAATPPVPMDNGGPPVASLASSAPATPPPASQSAASMSPQQLMLAQSTGNQLLAFVSSSSGKMPPIWDNAAAQAQASQARASMQGQGRARRGEPSWRIGGNTASMTTEMRLSDEDRRRLRVNMVWRDQRWLVRSLVLEADQ